MKKYIFGTKTVFEFGEPFIIADIGANFNGDLDLAKEMIIKAKEVGVDAVKFQSWNKHTFSPSLYRNKPADITAFGHKSMEEFLDFLSISEEQLWEMKEFCDEQQILFSSTPFSFHDVDVLVDMDVPFIKIASMELNHPAFIKYTAEKGKPLILSTGMGTTEEIKRAVETITLTNNDQLILLHCTALYPPLDEEVNLNNIDYLREVFGYPTGYSDHTIGYSMSLASAVKGACVIEKHYTLDKTMPGWDHVVSATPEEFKIIVEETKRIVKALGHKERIVGERENEKKKSLRRSIVAKRDLSAGTKVSFEDIDFKRPATGIPPDQINSVIGSILNSDVKADTLLSYDKFV